MSNLYVVSTPIGNLQDITIRAASLLLESNILVTESTSKAGVLLDFLEKKFGSKRLNGQKIISMNEEEEQGKIPFILSALEVNDAALISEAGTPLISDPGFKLVREAIKRGIRIIPVPGPSSITAALVVSGLPTNKFKFIGFPPKSRLKRKNEFKILTKDNCTIILFESPHRIIDTLRDMLDVFGDMEIVLARELTKIHEEIIRGKISELLLKLKQRAPRGEWVILFYF
jgi:16S rRNA (cytidine1402-2'-O)-methyltransferase